MSIVHGTVTRNAIGSSVISGTDNQTGGVENNISELIPKNTTNKHISPATIVKAQLYSIFMLASGANLTVKTNHNGTPVPDDTFELLNGIPFVWTATYAANAPVPLTADVVDLYVTNGSSTTASTLTIRTLSDATP